MFLHRYVYETVGGQSFFVKTARRRDADEMFRGEALGLRAMHGATHSRLVLLDARKSTAITADKQLHIYFSAICSLRS